MCPKIFPKLLLTALILNLGFVFGANHSILKNLDEPETSQEVQERPRLKANGEQPKACQLVPVASFKPLLDGKLSPFWAQEYIGADLAREAAANEGGAETPVGILDAGFENNEITGKISKGANSNLYSPHSHGTAVANLINGAAPVGVSGLARLEALGGIGRSELLKSLLAIRSKDVSIVNASLYLEDFYKDELIRPLLKKLLTKSIWVVAAGNSNLREIDLPFGWEPPRSRMQSGNTQISEVITAGSISPYGTLSDFSNEGENVTVLAPSDRWVLSKTNEISRFGGTSGAAPLVTGALANVLALLPDLSLEEASELLRRTAQPTINSHQRPQRNGAGLLNAYKLVEVAKRLKNAGWPKGRKQLINDPSIYNFSELARVLLAEGKKLLQEDDCQKKRDGLSKIRRSFLLDYNDESRKILISIYGRENFSANASFYKSFDRQDFKPVLSELLTARFDGRDAQKDHRFPLKRSAIRTAGLMGAEGVDLIRQGVAHVETADFDELELALKASGEIGEKGAGFVKHVIDEYEKNNGAQIDDGVLAAAAGAASHLGQGGLVLLTRLTQDLVDKPLVSDAKFRLQLLEPATQNLVKNVIEGVAKLNGDTKIIERMLEPRINIDVQRLVLSKINSLKEKAIPLLENVLSRKEGLQSEILHAAYQLGEAGLPVIRRVNERSSNYFLSRIEAAAMLGKEGLPNLERAVGDSSPVRAEAAAYYALKYQGEGGLPVLKIALHHPQGSVRSSVFQAFDNSKLRPWARELFEEGIKDKESSVRGATLARCDVLGSESLSILKQGMMDTDSSVRADALEAALRLWAEGVPLRTLGENGVRFLRDQMDRREGSGFKDQNFIIREIIAELNQK